ncbi:MAG: M23 family metallopeptidase [Bacteroidia bacterium]
MKKFSIEDLKSFASDETDKTEVPQWPISSFKSLGEFGAGDKRHKGKHDGIDLAAPASTPVYPMLSGKVTKVSSESRLWVEGDPKQGNALTIVHDNGMNTFYAHLEKVTVSDGTLVTQTTQIGTNGMSGNARNTSPHVHFEVRNKGNPVNPRSVIGKADSEIKPKAKAPKTKVEPTTTTAPITTDVLETTTVPETTVTLTAPIKPEARLKILRELNKFGSPYREPAIIEGDSSPLDISDNNKKILINEILARYNKREIWNYVIVLEKELGTLNSANKKEKQKIIIEIFEKIDNKLKSLKSLYQELSRIVPEHHLIFELHTIVNKLNEKFEMLSSICHKKIILGIGFDKKIEEFNNIVLEYIHIVKTEIKSIISKFGTLTRALSTKDIINRRKQLAEDYTPKQSIIDVYINNYQGLFHGSYLYVYVDFKYIKEKIIKLKEDIEYYMKNKDWNESYNRSNFVPYIHSFKNSLNEKLELIDKRANKIIQITEGKGSLIEYFNRTYNEAKILIEDILKETANFDNDRDSWFVYSFGNILKRYIILLKKLEEKMEELENCSNAIYQKVYKEYYDNYGKHKHHKLH